MKKSFIKSSMFTSTIYDEAEEYRKKAEEGIKQRFVQVERETINELRAEGKSEEEIKNIMDKASQEIEEAKEKCLKEALKTYNEKAVEVLLRRNTL